MQKNCKKGFSLIELIFIIAILGIIAAVAVPKLMGSKSSAITATIKQDIATISTSIQSYYLLNEEIDKISDSVNVNENIWSIADKKLEYNIDDTLCVSIEVTTSTLSIDINEDSTDLCKEIYNSGVVDTSYDLF